MSRTLFRRTSSKARLTNSLPPQWQRISLARSLVKSVNDLLVWDEPAAALSPTAEAGASLPILTTPFQLTLTRRAELFDHILSMRGSRTIVFTTHRFSVTRHADRILCFAKGKLLENGSHDELMAVKDGQYKKVRSRLRSAMRVY